MSVTRFQDVSPSSLVATCTRGILVVRWVAASRDVFTMNFPNAPLSSGSAGHFVFRPEFSDPPPAEETPP
ncbi:hypothetical protein DFO67_101281 [Modicisalibacter xianhensis]|uniref:Uncharacterized protein n=1 Tax=Modicisalibacter xianhensis TaxID=442341 RepID=A0A4R8G432_9GAMM|nr:hypothetical protein DFO67_101281 [Halomonas xianhensis]